jgi:hypothetical protein
VTTPVDIHADLRLSRGDHLLEVAAAGDRVILRAADWRALVELWRLRPPRLARRRWIGIIHRGLSAMGLTVEVRLRARHLLSLGEKPRWGRLARLLGFVPAD